MCTMQSKKCYASQRENGHRKQRSRRNSRAFFEEERLSKRFPNLATQTPANIGPGTYNATEPSCPPRLLAENYPFLSGAKRKFLSVSKDAQRLPGPDAYNIKEPQKHIPGGVSIDFTDARFKHTLHEGPGPIYDVSEDLLKPKRTRSHPCKPRGPAGRLWLVRPPRSLLPLSTSVPGKFYTGYSIDQWGILRKNHPIKHEPPGFYNIPREETCYTTLKYKGNFWSRMTGRTGPKLSQTPSPGDYEHETKKTAAQIRDEEIRQANRGAAKQLRFLDMLSRRKLLENFPAPNSYTVKGAFDKFRKSDCHCDPYSVKPVPFLQSAKRFTYKLQLDVPGPGTYTPKIPSKCVASFSDAPFGVWANRFHKMTTDPGPAPSEYHTDFGNLAYESQKRFKQTHQQQVYYKHVDNTSTFDDYQEDSEVAGTSSQGKSETCHVYHAAFKSRTARFPTTNKVDVPDPGAYDVLKAFKANRDKCDNYRQRLCAPFGSKSRRFPKIPREEDIMRPDATSYELAVDIAKNVTGGLMLLPAKDRKKIQIPGPAHYCLHPYMLSSVLKKSFNSALSKPKVIAALENVEKGALQSDCRCTKKKLRWFAEPVKKYKHCSPPCILL